MYLNIIIIDDIQSSLCLTVIYMSILVILLGLQTHAQWCFKLAQILQGKMPRIFSKRSRATDECNDNENPYHLVLFVIVDVTDTCSVSGQAVLFLAIS
jgi:hypothetical protein